MVAGALLKDHVVVAIVIAVLVDVYIGGRRPLSCRKI